jgi:hypothetical protein
VLLRMPAPDTSSTSSSVTAGTALYSYSYQATDTCMCTIYSAGDTSQMFVGSTLYQCFTRFYPPKAPLLLGSLRAKG